MVEVPAKFEVIQKYQKGRSPAQNENPCYAMRFEVEEETKGSGCGQPQAGSALNEVLKLNLNDVDYNMFQVNQRSQIIS